MIYKIEMFVILIPSILTGQAKTLYPHRTLGFIPPSNISRHPNGFDAGTDQEQ